MLPPFVAREVDGDLGNVFSTVDVVDVVDGPRRLQRYATHSFSCLELRLDLSRDGAEHPTRLVSLLAFEQGRPAGRLAYSVDVVDR